MKGKERIAKRAFKVLVAATMVVTSTQFGSFAVQAEVERQNFALNQEASANYEDSANGFDAEKAFDGNDELSSRWAAKEGERTGWLSVDLGRERTFDEFRILAEKDAQKIGKFTIEGSHDGNVYETIFQSEDKTNDGGYDVDYTVKLNAPVTYRYVKITVESLVAGAYPSVSLREFEVLGDKVAETPMNENLALNKAVTASAEYGSMPASNLTDADKDSRWSTEKNPPQWAYVDLGQTYEMNTFAMAWEDAQNNASDYKIYVSNDPNNWGEAVVDRAGNTSATSTEFLQAPVTGRYVKLEITKQNGYPSVSCRNFEVMLTDGQQLPQDPQENVALNKDATSSSNETSGLNASKAFDGDHTTRDSRWASALGNGPHWISVDLGEVRNIKTVRLFWETRKATDYEIQVSNTGEEDSWQTVKHIESRPATKTDRIVLDEVVRAQYVRLMINDFTAQDPDGGVEWNTISLYEMEVYGGIIEDSASDIANQITIKEPQKGDTELVINYPETDKYLVEYNGTDFEQVVDENLHIYQPVVDKVVKVSFKITDKETNEYEFKEIGITIPGKYQQEETDNPAPVILPELAEWKGFEGNFTVLPTSRIVYSNADLKAAAEAMAEDYELLTGKAISVVQGDQPQAGDFYFVQTTDTSKGLMEEGYIMEVDDVITVTSETKTGAYWATRTILQALKQSDYTTIAKGETRDYPLYEVRGFIMDVARKTFTLDYLKQLVKEMSWYKMNDFQVHLNDNLIPLEYYSQNGMDPLDAYSAFRLESDIKKGGNNGLNQADLTSTDLFYTKDEFREFIKDSRELGVNIVPEIDTPAHSLALTKVRPDLRNGTYGRENDHLNLVGKYDESLEFVQSIFSEYLTEENPVFDSQTTVHIGADEYNASSQAYRKFVNDMLDFVEGTGRKARVWGSFTQASQGEDIDAEGVEINLWNFGYANMDKMYEDGFDLINCNDGNYYIVPNAGYYYDYLSDSTMYNLDINTISGVTIPAGDDQMKGGAFAVWNDMTDYLDNGVSEYDVYDRIERGLPLFAAKLWGKGEMNLEEAKATSDSLGDAPGTNFGYEVESKEDAIINMPMDEYEDTSANDHQIEQGVNAQIETVDFKKALRLNGGQSYISTDLETVGLGNDLRVKVKRTSDSTEEQILFESPYGNIKAVQKDTGKVGFSRERFDFSFNYTLPVNEWVELEFKNQQNRISLYVNGELVDTLGDDERIEGRPMLATTMFPIQTIGSKTNAFIGYVDDLRLGKNDTFASTMALDYAIWNGEAVLANMTNSQLRTVIDEAKSVLTEYAPSKDTVDSYVSQINDLLSQMDYKKADYSRLNAYLALTKDLSEFTDESIASVNQVIEGIRLNLPVQLQSTVDAYEKALVQALDNLELKDKTDLNLVDSTKLTATASSYQQDGSNPSNVLDGSTSTMWHSAWNITTMPHYIDLEIDESTEVKGLIYTPRQSGTNGNLLEYQIQVSDDGVDYETIATGTLENNAQAKTIDFGPVTTKHVRLVYVRAVNNNASASEINLIQANVSPDVEGLQAVIDNAKAMSNVGYTDETWTAFQDVIKEAEALVNSENPGANEVEAMKQTIASSIVALRLGEEEPVVADKTALQIAVDLADQVTDKDLENVVPAVVEEFKAALQEAKEILADETASQEDVNASFDRLASVMQKLEFYKGDKTALKAFIDDVSNLDSTKYSTDTWAAFEKELNEAIAVYEDVNAMQEEVNNAHKELVTAFLNLRLLPDKSLLEELINKAEGLNSANYTKASFDGLTKALNEAKVVFNDPNATQEQVDNAKAVLEKAIAGLQTVTTDNTVKTPVNNGDTTSVKTGDTTNLWYPLATLALASVALYGSKKRKK